MPKSSDNHEFEFVNESELRFAKRGRKSQVNPEIVAQIKMLTAGKCLTIKSLRVDPKDKSRKATVSAQLRSCGKAAGVEVDIQFTVDGVPTVRLRSRSKS
jgi:hypothetical protein